MLFKRKADLQARFDSLVNLKEMMQIQIEKNKHFPAIKNYYTKRLEEIEEEIKEIGKKL